MARMSDPMNKIMDIQESIVFEKARVAAALARINDLEEALRKEMLPERPHAEAMSVSLQFEPNGQRYRFLILYVPGKGYYTTGTMPENQYFATWAHLWKYLDGPDVVMRSALTDLGSFADARTLLPGRSGR